MILALNWSQMTEFWVFGTSDTQIFEEWMQTLRDLCFGKAVHSGFLRKIGEKYKTWKCRYFIIYDLNEIRYFEDDSLSTQKVKLTLIKSQNHGIKTKATSLSKLH
eukprot:TRINITY_DN21981_c0_g1_i1.p1 TRINITY_DN21981_c0_g1~~TRINITY_DN21981_c0_g1_i1.p1  ORF type:complete len:105 (-),score=11.59 TRINITY_DN21981_c0_g1_i1:62-376(-)